jgi:predicted nucleic acid-binding protein
VILPDVNLLHWPLLKQLLEAVSVGANLTTAAHPAALAIEHGYTLYSNDSDFSRFTGLKWQNPLTDS